MTRMIEWIKKWWFLVSSFLIGILYVLWDRRGTEIDQARDRSQAELLTAQLKAIESRNIESQEDYEKALRDYNALKLHHAELLKRLGLPSQSDAPRDPGSN